MTGVGRTSKDSPWRQWRQAKLRELLPEPPDIDGLLATARDDDATASARADAIARTIVRLQVWFDEFATAAFEADATDGLSPETIFDRAREKETPPQQPRG